MGMAEQAYYTYSKSGVRTPDRTILCTFRTFRTFRTFPSKSTDPYTFTLCEGHSV